MKVIDCHAHLGKLFRKSARNDTWDTFQHAEQLMNLNDEYDIDAAVASSYKSIQYNFHEGNKELGQIIQEADGKLIGYATVHPGLEEEAIEGLYTAINEYGLQGLKIHPERQWVNLDYSYMNPIMEITAELGVPTLIHTHHSSGLCSIEQVVDLASRHPEAIIIMAHMGLDPLLAAELSRDYENVILESSGVLPRIEEIEKAIEIVGSERVVYGSDFPGHHPELEIRKMELLNISSREKENILGKNAERIFGCKTNK